MSIPGWKKTELEDCPRFMRWAAIPVFAFFGAAAAQLVTPLLPDPLHPYAYAAGAIIGLLTREIPVWR